MHSTQLPGIADLSSVNRCVWVEERLALAHATPSVFIRHYDDQARHQAQQADIAARAGKAQHPLAGLPVSIKDMLDVAGETTLAASTVLREAPPAQADASVVQRLRKTGAAILGKSNMTEFAYSGVGINPHYGTPGNPADTTRIPGGSSSGAAVSVGAGICVAAVGSDTGGSLRIPAALCGVVGFKPTQRRVPRTGIVPLAPSFDSIGPIAGNVADCALLDSVLADSPLTLPALKLADLRLAVPTDLVLDQLDDAVSKAFASALSCLSAAGANIDEIRLPMLSEAREINLLSPIEAYAWHKNLLPAHAKEYDPRVVTRIMMGADVSPDQTARLYQARADWCLRMNAAMKHYDALLMPTVPIVAPKTSTLLASDEAFFEANWLLLRNTSLINVLDGCAISLPCHRAGDLPVGLMIASRAMDDARVLSIAALAESVLTAAQ